MGHIREVRDGDIEYVAERLRDADLREVQAASGLEPHVALRYSYELSGLACTIVGDQGHPVALFGVSPIDDVTGCVWLLSSDELTKGKLGRQFVRECRSHFDRLNDYRPLLTNFVDERNTVHIRWLKWAGCHFIQRCEKYGVEHRPFLEFVRVK